MWYDLTKCIYNNMNESKRNELWWKSEDLEACAKKIIDDMNDSKIYNRKMSIENDFKTLKNKMLDYLVVCSKIGEETERGSEIICKKFGEDKYEMFSKQLCTFYYFLINKMDAWKNEDFEIYISLLKSAGISHSPASFESMEDAITMHIMKTDRNFDRWLKLIKDWKEHEDYYSKDMVSPFISTEENKLDFTYLRLKELLAFDENEERKTQGTRMSLNHIFNSMNEIMNNPQSLYATRVEELFKGYNETIKLILDTETRRQWYFLHMIEDIIEHQIDQLLDAAENGNKEEFTKIRNNIWLEKSRDVGIINKPWCNITIGYDIEEIEDAINVSYITAAKVFGGFCDCLDKIEYIDIDPKTGKDEIIRLRSLIFENKAIIEGEYTDSDERYDMEKHNANRQYRNGYNHFRDHIFSGRKVTKELLLLTVLVSFANGVEYSPEYITNHILFNSRYAIDLDVNNLFIEFYKDTIDEMKKKESLEERKEIMRENARAYQEDYYSLRERSLFYDIISGVEIL